MLIDTIAQDLCAYAKSEHFLVKIKIVLISHAFHLVLFYRLGCAIAKCPIVGNILRVFFEYLIRIIFASDISLKSQIKPGLVIMHGHDIVIGSDVIIGEYCKILNGVTLGNKNTESPVNAQPIIGDNVVIGSGAKIMGNIHVGNNVLIGANSVVIKDVSDHVTVAGVPAKVLKSRHDF